MVAPLQYIRALTPPMEDTRRVVTMYAPDELARPDEAGTYLWNGWRGRRTKSGGGVWQTVEPWGRDIADFPGEEGGPGTAQGADAWHVTRRDISVDVETAQVPEQWWCEWFGGTRGTARNATGDVVSWPGGTQGGHSNAKGTTVELGSRRAAVMLRMYVKFLRLHVDIGVRQCHVDAWHAAGWQGGMVVRVEFECKRPCRLDGTPAEVWADAKARLRLLDKPASGRASDRPTAERWAELGGVHVQKRAREKAAPHLATLRLRRAVDRLTALYGKGAVRLALAGGGHEELATVLAK